MRKLFTHRGLIIGEGGGPVGGSTAVFKVVRAVKGGDGRGLGGGGRFPRLRVLVDFRQYQRGSDGPCWQQEACEGPGSTAAGWMWGRGRAAACLSVPAQNCYHGVILCTSRFLQSCHSTSSATHCRTCCMCHGTSVCAHADTVARSAGAA
jgi:hypothetical protein